VERHDRRGFDRDHADVKRDKRQVAAADGAADAATPAQRSERMTTSTPPMNAGSQSRPEDDSGARAPRDEVLVAPQALAGADPSRRWTVREAWQAMTRGTLRYVDIRDDAELAAGWPPGAAHIALYATDEQGRARLSRAFVPAVRALVEAAKRGEGPPRVALGCAHGVRSRQAVGLLAAFGVVVDEVPGGWDGLRDELGRVREDGWLQAGLPVERPAPPDER
jgi:rhodanese-related sulfurtransferase